MGSVKTLEGSPKTHLMGSCFEGPEMFIVASPELSTSSLALGRELRFGAVQDHRNVQTRR